MTITAYRKNKFTALKKLKRRLYEYKTELNQCCELPNYCTNEYKQLINAKYSALHSFIQRIEGGNQ